MLSFEILHLIIFICMNVNFKTILLDFINQNIIKQDCPAQTVLFYYV